MTLCVRENVKSLEREEKVKGEREREREGGGKERVGVISI